MENTIEHGTVAVNDEVLLFLQQDKRREEAEARSDRRHLSKTDFTAVEITIYKGFDLDPTFSVVYNKILLEHLYAAIAKLSKPEQKLVQLYYFERWTMEEIGKEFGISKMAVSKRMQQLFFHMQDLMKTWGPVIFLKNFKFLVYKPSTTVLYSRGFFFWVAVNKENKIERRKFLKESSYKSYEDLPLFLNAKTISKVLGIAPSSAYELMHEESFPVIKIGKRMVVAKDKFISCVENQSGGER